MLPLIIFHALCSQSQCIDLINVNTEHTHTQTQKLTKMGWKSNLYIDYGFDVLLTHINWPHFVSAIVWFRFAHFIFSIAKRNFQSRLIEDKKHATRVWFGFEIFSFFVRCCKFNQIQFDNRIKFHYSILRMRIESITHWLSDSMAFNILSSHRS